MIIYKHKTNGYKSVKIKKTNQKNKKYSHFILGGVDD